MNRKSWLGNRQVWHPTQTTAGTRGRATNVLYNRERIPWLVSGKIITAFIAYDDYSLSFYDTSRLDDLDSKNCFWKIDRDVLHISALAEFLFWPGAEAIFAEYGTDLPDVYPSNLFTEQIFRFWFTAKMPRWVAVDRGAGGVSFISEITGINGVCKHAVELTDKVFAIYKHDLLRSSALAERDQILCLNIEQLDMDRLLVLMQPDDAVTVRYIARMTRCWLYQFAVNYENA